MLTIRRGGASTSSFLTRVPTEMAAQLLQSALAATLMFPMSVVRRAKTFITLDPNKTQDTCCRIDEIFRLPMRGYYSANGGTSWGGS